MLLHVATVFSRSLDRLLNELANEIEVTEQSSDVSSYRRRGHSFFRIHTVHQ